MPLVFSCPHSPCAFSAFPMEAESVKSIVSALYAKHAEIVILPPVGARVPSSFRHVSDRPESYRCMLSAVQRFRGSIYLEDGAICQDELTADGRHDVPIDEKSWHVITIDSNGRIWACLRFLEEHASSHFDRLWMRQAAITSCPSWGSRVRRAVEEEMAVARRESVRFGEVGGWATDRERRCTIEGVRTVLATYGLLQVLGGCVGIATATRRHGSAPILRRIGLSPLRTGDAEVPPYFDPRYGCEMELLRYDSRRPAAKYDGWVDELSSMLVAAPVICDSVAATRSRTLVHQERYAPESWASFRSLAVAPC